jgi:putative CocE/NonD family hydrolase
VAPRRRARRERRSLYVTMRDGVRLAVDVHLPHDAGSALPTILRQTRYYRSIAFNPPFAQLPIRWMLDHAEVTRERFVANGFAWVDVCARGSGASFGHRPCPWSPDETADGAEIVDWIVAQPWSNGRVGTTGVSYDGTTAEMLLVNGHPAVRAAAPRFSLYDTFADVAFPGGIHLTWFTALWSMFNRSLDAGELDAAFASMIGLQLEALADLRGDDLLTPLLHRLAKPSAQPFWGLLLRAVARGVRPADTASLAAAIADHGDNFDVHQGALGVTYRDDAGVSPEIPDGDIDLFSPHHYRERIEASGTPILSVTGWLDGAYQHSAIKRFSSVRTKGSQLIIGPWDHGGRQHVSPHCAAAHAGFDHDAALVRFFAHHLRDEDNGVGSDPPVRYFTIGTERWRATDGWPPADAETKTWYLDQGRGLSPSPPSSGDATDAYRVDETVGSGRRSRWASLLGLLVPVGYSRRRQLGRRMLLYRSPPLSEAMTVAGHPIVELHLSADTDDANVFVYLEDEDENGHVEYVTEGQLRALHRRTSSDAPYDGVVPYRSFRRTDGEPLVPGEPAVLRFGLLPVAWRFGRAHRIRLAIAGHDADHFAKLPMTPTLVVHRSSERASRIELPVVRAC